MAYNPNLSLLPSAGGTIHPMSGGAIPLSLNLEISEESNASSALATALELSLSQDEKQSESIKPGSIKPLEPQIVQESKVSLEQVTPNVIPKVSLEQVKLENKTPENETPEQESDVSLGQETPEKTITLFGNPLTLTMPKDDLTEDRTNDQIKALDLLKMSDASPDKQYKVLKALYDGKCDTDKPLAMLSTCEPIRIIMQNLALKLLVNSTEAEEPEAEGEGEVEGEGEAKVEEKPEAKPKATEAKAKSTEEPKSTSKKPKPKAKSTEAKPEAKPIEAKKLEAKAVELPLLNPCGKGERKGKLLPVVKKNNLGGGDCFYSAIFRAATEQKILDKINGVYETIDISDEMKFIQSFRNLVAENFRRRQTVSENSDYNLYNILKDKKESYRASIDAFPRWFQKAFPTIESLGTEDAFFQRLANLAGTLGNDVGEAEAVLVRYLLHLCHIYLDICTGKTIPPQLVKITDDNYDVITLHNPGEYHYQYMSFEIPIRKSQRKTSKNNKTQKKRVMFNMKVNTKNIPMNNNSIEERKGTRSLTQKEQQQKLYGQIMSNAQNINNKGNVIPYNNNIEVEITGVNKGSKTRKILKK